MTWTILSRSRISRRSWSTALVLALALTLTVAFGALAESYRAVEGPWTVSTSGYSTPIGDGTGNVFYNSHSYAHADDGAGLQVLANGYNNGGGWHLTASQSCNASTDCVPPDLTYDTSENPNSSARYTASEHVVNGYYYYYTSTDGAHSSNACVVTPGC